MRNYSFEGWSPQYHLGYELYGKTLRIIGLGEIGKAVAKIACAFGMKVIYNKRSPLDKLAERFLNAFTTNSIKGAALDVFENEPKISQDLASLKNVILTPHIGNATYEARNAMARVAAENIIEALEGQTPRYLVGYSQILSRR